MESGKFGKLLASVTSPTHGSPKGSSNPECAAGAGHASFPIQPFSPQDLPPSLPLPPGTPNLPSNSSCTPHLPPVGLSRLDDVMDELAVGRQVILSRHHHHLCAHMARRDGRCLDPSTPYELSYPTSVCLDPPAARLGVHTAAHMCLHVPACARCACLLLCMLPQSPRAMIHMHAMVVRDIARLHSPM